MTFCSYSNFINDSCQKSVELSRAYLGVHQTAIILLSVSYAYQCKHQLQCFTWEDNLNRNPQSLWRVLNNLAPLENERGIHKTPELFRIQRFLLNFRKFPHSQISKTQYTLFFDCTDCTSLSAQCKPQGGHMVVTGRNSNYRGHCSDTRYITSKRRVQILL